jgi:hypothetical protein
MRERVYRRRRAWVVVAVIANGGSSRLRSHCLGARSTWMLVGVAPHGLRSSRRRRRAEDICEGSFPSTIVSSSLLTVLLGHLATVNWPASTGTGPFSGSRRKRNQKRTRSANCSVDRCGIKRYGRGWIVRTGRERIDDGRTQPSTAVEVTATEAAEVGNAEESVARSKR